MIPSVANYLETRNYLPKGYDGDVNIFMGRSSFLHFFLSDDTSLAVKIEDRGADKVKALEKEARALQEVHNLYTGLIPRFIALGHTDKFNILVMAGMTITTASIEDVMFLSGKQRELMQRLLSGEDRIVSLEDYTPGKAAEVMEPAIELLPDELSQKYKNIMKDREWEEFLNNMPFIPQHGDLAINNVGKTDTGIIVFDWEDYGLINIPGFDLCVMLLSGCRFNNEQLNRIVHDIYQDTEGKDHFFMPVLTKLNIQKTQIIDFLMVHLILFHDLKCNLGYGEEVIHNIRRLLHELTPSSAE